MLSPPTSPQLLDPSSIVEMIEDFYDLLGIGFGPANLALSIALRESSDAQECGLRSLFVERQANFAWHSSLLLPGSQLQVSPLKDLATMRDPTSSYTFFNYLHQQGRLAAYINREANVPSRKEWSAYLSWAAKRMCDVVEYCQEVIAVEAKQEADGRIRMLKVTTRDLQSGNFTIRFAKNITVAVGGVPRLPLPFHHLYNSYRSDKIQQIVHSSSYLPSLAALEPMLREREAKRTSDMARYSSTRSSIHPAMHPPGPLRFAVIGGGQSSAEMSLHLRKTFPKSDVKLIFRASALVPSDDSAFVNGAAFDPERTDVFWKANTTDRKAWTEEYRRTNYSVIRSDVLNEIHDTLYDQEIEVDQPWPNANEMPICGKLGLLPNTEVHKVEADEESGLIRLSTLHTKQLDQEQTLLFDAVFLGTGFQRQPNAFQFLKPVSHFFPLLDANSRQRKEELGFGEEAETNELISQLMESSDEVAVERLRQRTRGIARDYQLVSYLSDAFSHSSLGGVSSTGGSGASSPTRACQSTTSSSQSSATTLASNDNSSTGKSAFEPSIFVLGGNEQTHGLADSLLSLVAHRAGELCESIIKSHSTSSSLDSQDLKSSLQNVLPPSLKTLLVETLEERVQSMQTA